MSMKSVNSRLLMHIQKPNYHFRREKKKEKKKKVIIANNNTKKRKQKKTRFSLFVANNVSFK